MLIFNQHRNRTYRINDGGNNRSWHQACAWVIYDCWWSFEIIWNHIWFLLWAGVTAWWWFSEVLILSKITMYRFSYLNELLCAFGDSFGFVCMIRARRLRNIWCGWVALLQCNSWVDNDAFPCLTSMVQGFRSSRCSQMMICFHVLFVTFSSRWFVFCGCELALKCFMPFFRMRNLVIVVKVSVFVPLFI